MKYDTKIFLKYIFSEINPKNWMKNTNFYKLIILFILLYSVYFLDFQIQKKVFISVIGMIILIAIEIYVIHKSGYHRRWWRDKTGIPTKSEIKKWKFQKEKNY